MARVRELRGASAARADEAGLSRLCDEHAPALMAYVARLIGDRQMAEDVVQETLLLAVASGELDRLSGRFLRAGDDTPAELVARTYEIQVADARRLRLVPYGPTDPLRP